MREGSGDIPKTTAQVEIQYVGFLGIGGKQFIEHREVIELGKKQNIKGLEMGVTSIKEGSRVKLWIPSKLGYGMLLFFVFIFCFCFYILFVDFKFLRIFVCFFGGCLFSKTREQKINVCLLKKVKEVQVI